MSNFYKTVLEIGALKSISGIYLKVLLVEHLTLSLLIQEYIGGLWLSLLLDKLSTGMERCKYKGNGSTTVSSQNPFWGKLGVR